METMASRLVIAALLFLGTAACSDGEAEAGVANQVTAVSTPVAAAPDGGVISLRGSVIASTPAGFMLDYGSGRMLVEMDDWDWFQEGRAVKAGDEVVVTGVVDRDLFENRKIEASSVYVSNLGAYFYASGADEEEVMATTLLAPSATTSIVGTVRAIEGREFALGHENMVMRIDTSQMSDNPLDSQGNVQVRTGDRVFAWGRLDVDPGEAGELLAQGVIVMRADRTKQAEQTASSASTGNAGAGS